MNYYCLIVLVAFLHVYCATAETLVQCTDSTTPLVTCLKVGFTYASGRLDPEGGEMKNGYILWAEKVNAGDGISTSSGAYKIQLIGYNDLSNQSLSAEYYNYLINQDHVDYLLGPYGSSFSAVASAVADKAGKVLILSSGSDDTLYSKGYNMVFGVTTPGSKYAAPLVEKLASLGATSAAIKYASDGFSTSVKNGASNSLSSAKITASDVQMFFSSNITQANSVNGFNSVKSLNPDIFMFLGLYDDATPATLAADQVGFKPKAFFMTSAPSQLAFVTSMGQKVNYFLSPVQWHPKLNYTGPFFGTSADYANTYFTRFNTNVTAISAQASAAGLVLQIAITKGDGKVNQTALAQILRTNSFDCFFGQLSFGSNGASQKQILITQVINNNIEVVLPTQYQTHPIVYPRSDYSTSTTTSTTSNASTTTTTTIYILGIFAMVVLAVAGIF